MAAVELRCRQCGWTSRVAADRLPRYGARVRCPRCDALQLVLGGPASSPAGEEHPELEVDRPSAAAPAPIPASPSAPPPAPAAEPPLGDEGGEERALTAEARQLLRLWLEELRRQTGAPLDVARVFGEHGEELAHLYSLWSASHPGERSQALFRRELLGALESLAGTGGPPAPVQGPSSPGR
jgi:hypothetical protein